MSEDLTKTLPQSDSEKLSLILSTVQAVAVRADNVEQTVKLKLYDTRPVWQKVLTDLAQLQEGQQRLEDGQESLRSELREMRSDMNHRFRVLSGQTLAEVRDLQKRVTNVERKSPPNSQT